MVGEIEDKKCLEEFNAYISKVVPDESLRHLKKVKCVDAQIQVILGKEELIKSHLDLLKEKFNLKNIKTTKVPASQPFTDAQYTSIKDIWPVNFHYEKSVRKILDGSIFNAKDLSYINEYLNSVEAESDQGPGVCLIVNQKQKVLAKGIDKCPFHPLKHCAVDAINKVSEILLSEKDTDSYICTGTDVFISKEPCVMCAMALLHSRIGRMFILESKSTHGCPPDGSISRLKIHVNSKLNHRFNCWTASRAQSDT